MGRSESRADILCFLECPVLNKKITRYTNKQGTVTHSQEKKQPTETVSEYPRGTDYIRQKLQSIYYVYIIMWSCEHRTKENHNERKKEYGNNEYTNRDSPQTEKSWS